MTLPDTSTVVWPDKHLFSQDDLLLACGEVFGVMTDISKLCAECFKLSLNDCSYTGWEMQASSLPNRGHPSFPQNGAEDLPVMAPTEGSPNASSFKYFSIQMPMTISFFPCPIKKQSNYTAGRIKVGPSALQKSAQTNNIEILGTLTKYVVLSYTKPPLLVLLLVSWS